MLWFILGQSLAWCGLCAYGLAVSWNDLRHAPGAVAIIAMSMIAIPVIIAWLASEMVNLVSPRRIFERRVKRWWVSATLGLGAGVLGVIVMAGGLLISQESLADAWITGIAAAASALVLMATPHVRAGACIHCGYDQSAATPSGEGRCPECGAQALAAA